MGLSYLYTGDGGGKTTNALGMALRSLGHGKKVVLIQFLKWRKDIGEYMIQERLGPDYEVHQFGRRVWLGTEHMTYEFDGDLYKVERPGERDRQEVMRAMKFARTVMMEKAPDLLILDEVNLAVHWELLDSKEVIELMDAAPVETTIVLTGRFAPPELIDRADFVNEIKEIKAPKDFTATKGIQY